MLLSIVFLPLYGSLLALLRPRWVSKFLIIPTTCAMVVGSAGLSIWCFKELMPSQTLHLFPWIISGDLQIYWGLHSDALVAVLLVIITLISSLVHIYTLGYLRTDPNLERFLGLLSLFTFFMILLVTSDNLLQLFLGWEGVGFTSYLLIGFWYHKPQANAAAYKAFIVNRIADVGFVIAICLVYFFTGTAACGEVFAHMSKIPDLFLTLICSLFLIGAISKSAQLGFHIWLPDAMEGPTPASALIHSATMVTAGVFMIVKLSPLFEHAPAVLDAMVILGSATVVFGGIAACVQHDIKKIIAYSTCSQLGYMILACGLSGYALALFHLLTHAFFKALLFLSAGSVIHAFSGEQDIRYMGGCARTIPFTYAGMWVGILALSGFPFLSGYYSKEAILMAAYTHKTYFSLLGFSAGLISVILTAFYSLRILLKVFHGPIRATDQVAAHLHESPPVMLLPLGLLAIGAISGGQWLSAPFTSSRSTFWKETSLPPLSDDAPLVSWMPYVAFSLLVLGIGLALYFYLYAPHLSERLKHRYPRVYVCLKEAFYFNQFYTYALVRPYHRWSFFIANRIEKRIIDACFCGSLQALARYGGGKVSQWQTGFVYDYITVMIVGVCAITVLFLWYI